MSELRTKAGRALLAILPGPDERGNGIDWRGRIERIEAEAARLAASPSLEGATATTDAQGYVTSIEDSHA